MKALSIRQPWAWLILNGGKRVENRSWANCYYRGPLLIHAAKGMTRSEYEDAFDFALGQKLITCEAPRFDDLERGGIVGVCNLVAVVDRKPNTLLGVVYKKPEEVKHTFDSRWYAGSLGLVLDNVRALPFTPYKGQLGFFDVPADLVNRMFEGAK